MADNAITRSALGSVQVGSYYFGQLAWQDRMIDLERTVRNAGDNTQKALGMMDSNFSRYVSALGHKLDRSLCAIADVAYEGFAELSGLLRDSLETQIGIHQELCKISFHSEKIAQALIEGRQTRVNEIFSGAIRLCE